jgi:plasmid stabilization system protein ParE
MKLEILEVAQNELEDAIMFYELEQSGLGRRFKTEVRQAIKRIKSYPQAWSVERGEVRKCFVHKFPYTIFYSLQKQTIVILVIAHQHRKPGYWIDRLEDAT